VREEPGSRLCAFSGSVSQSLLWRKELQHGRKLCPLKKLGQGALTEKTREQFLEWERVFLPHSRKGGMDRNIRVERGCVLDKIEE